jgi:hypothetical protein
MPKNRNMLHNYIIKLYSSYIDIFTCILLLIPIKTIVHITFSEITPLNQNI